MQGIWGHTELTEGTSVRCIKLRRRRRAIQAPVFGAAENIPQCNASSYIARTQLLLVPVAVAQKYCNDEHIASTLPLQLLLRKIYRLLKRPLWYQLQLAQPKPTVSTSVQVEVEMRGGRK